MDKFGFLDEERIVRIIYSEKNINPRNKRLKNNFFRFDYNSTSDRAELSCIRFEFETLDFCREFGTSNSDSAYDRNYYGLACISVKQIKQLNNFGIVFTPNFKSKPKNFFHCDVFDKAAHPNMIGVANPALINLQRDNFAKAWKPYEHGTTTKKDDVIPF